MTRGERRFWFRLAIKLGCTVAELQDRMSSAEFSEWIAFYQLEPFGWLADSRGPALVATMIQNRDLREDEQPIKMQDLMANDPPPPQTGSQMAQFARMFAAAGMGKIKE